MFRSGFTLRNVHQVADRLGLAQQAEYVAGYFVDHLLKIAFLSFLDVDWSQSKAYSFGRHLGSVYVNVKGREPQGIVEPGAEYEAVRDEIERLAYEFRDPRTGRKLIGEVMRREEVYSGPHVDQAPDLILRPKEPSDIFFGLADFGHRDTVSTVYRYSGMHRDYGMLIMNGPACAAGQQIEGAAIQDIAPTVLHIMGLPVPTDMDGRVLEDAFADGYMDAFPLEMADASAAAGNGATDADYTEEGEKEILERLARIGVHGMKVLVIGLDGVTFDLLGPWIEAGELPNLQATDAAGRLGQAAHHPAAHQFLIVEFLCHRRESRQAWPGGLCLSRCRQLQGDDGQCHQPPDAGAVELAQRWRAQGGPAGHPHHLPDRTGRWLYDQRFSVARPRERVGLSRRAQAGTAGRAGRVSAGARTNAIARPGAWTAFWTI